MNKNKTYTEEIFDKYFDEKKVITYSFDTKNMSRRDRQIVKYLTKYGIHGKKCLDIGPGTGRWLQFLKENGASYLAAIDISQEALNRCSKLCNKCQKANVENDVFGFNSNTFDIICSFMILEHLRDPRNYLSEIIRIAKNNALILMTIPNILSLTSRIRVILGKLPTAIISDKTHIKFYTKKEIIKLLKPFNLTPLIIPTSFSIHPINNKKLRIPSNKYTSSLDDHLLFQIKIKK